MVIKKLMENEVLDKNILVQKIEKARSELNKMVSDVKSDFNKKEVLQKSKELDMLLNEYHHK